jgi:hypothetical protein
MIHLKEKPQGLWPLSGGLTFAGLIPVALAGYALRNEAVPNESCLRFKTPTTDAFGAKNNL